MKDHNAIRDRFSKDFQLDLSTELTYNLMYGISIPYSLEKGSAYVVFHDTLSEWPGYANIMDIIDEVEVSISESIPSYP